MMHSQITMTTDCKKDGCDATDLTNRKRRENDPVRNSKHFSSLLWRQRRGLVSEAHQWCGNRANRDCGGRRARKIYVLCSPPSTVQTVYNVSCWFLYIKMSSQRRCEILRNFFALDYSVKFWRHTHYFEISRISIYKYEYIIIGRMPYHAWLTFGHNIPACCWFLVFSTWQLTSGIPTDDASEQRI